MKSPYGRRGSICAHLGWTWEYLHHNIPFGIVQRILIDFPSVEFDSDKENRIGITNENADELLKKFNRICQ
ncbi:MAG: hypothetical protein FWF53_03005 [Candidatus Azobacteroides sp.]|nr:hypothetical protein [Candidatus Azobacteroides sp.]